MGELCFVCISSASTVSPKDIELADADKSVALCDGCVIMLTQCLNAETYNIVYSQDCTKRSSLGKRKSGFIRQVTS
jgi:hypothetical protein